MCHPMPQISRKGNVNFWFNVGFIQQQESLKEWVLPQKTAQRWRQSRHWSPGQNGNGKCWNLACWHSALSCSFGSLATYSMTTLMLKPLSPLSRDSVVTFEQTQSAIINKCTLPIAWEIPYKLYVWQHYPESLWLLGTASHHNMCSSNYWWPLPKYMWVTLFMMLFISINWKLLTMQPVSGAMKRCSLASM